VRRAHKDWPKLIAHIKDSEAAKGMNNIIINWLTFMAFIIRALNGADTKQLLGEFRGGL